MRFRKSTHAVYNTQYHIVWTLWYRRKLLVKGVKEYLEKLFTNMDGIDEDIEVRKVNVVKRPYSYCNSNTTESFKLPML